jgi:hypothetical protein
MAKYFHPSLIFMSKPYPIGSPYDASLSLISIQKNIYKLLTFTKKWGLKEINLPNICIFPMDVHFLLPDGTTLTDVHTENMDVREVGSHPPQKW